MSMAVEAHAEREPDVTGELGLVGRLQGWEYRPPATITFDQWERDGVVLQELERRTGFWLGDWARSGLELFGQGRWSQAMREHGYALQTVKNASSTALKFPPHERIYEGLAYSHYQEAKDLPKAEARAALEHAREERLSTADFREYVRERKQVLRRAEVAALPTPRLTRSDVHLVVGDATALPLADDAVDAIMTSPPYALEKDYPNGDVATADWFDFCLAWAREAFRVARPGARMAVNVPIDTNLGGYRPTSAMMTGAALQAGWRYRSTIVWVDDQLGTSTARGSVDSSSSPNVTTPAEHIILFFKGDSWGLEAPADRPSDIAHDDWLEWTNGLWRFPGESSPWEYHPAPFPLELPRRLLHLLTFPGDLVLDPFLGSGTVALAAFRAGRRVVGVDRSPAYVASATRRLMKGAP